MKKICAIFILSLFASACAHRGPEHPEDLAGKKILLNQKKEEKRKLEVLIDQLNREIVELDPNSKPNVKLVVTRQFDKKEFNRFIEIQGTVVSDQLVSLASEVGGRIVELKAIEGQFVRKGQLLARLDLEELNKQLAEIETSLDLATTVYERQSRLWAQNIGSEIQYLEAKNNKERFEKSLETLKHRLSKANVYAPISGVIDRELMKQGEVVSPGMPIVQILNTGYVKVIADVPERYLNVIREGDYVRINIPTLGEEFRAKVNLLGRRIDPANRTFEVEVRLANGRGSLKPNLLAEMLINDFSEENSLVLPIDLIQEEVSGKEFVFVAETVEDGVFAKKVYIETGESYEGEILVRSGLEGTEEIIVTGARNLIQGEAIKVNNPSNI